MKVKWYAIRCIAVLVAMVMLFGCTPAVKNGDNGEVVDPDPVAAEDDRYGGELRIATDLVSSIIDPHLSNGLMASYQWMQYIFETPLAWSASGEFYPLLCDYDYSDDGLTLKLTVLPDRYFSDGTPVTLEDVMASIERTGKYYAGFKDAFADLLVNVEVVDDSVIYTLSEYNPNTLLRLSNTGGPCYVMKKELLDQLGEDGQVTDVSQLIGTGCYTLEKYEPETEIVLAKNPDYVPLESDGIGPAAPRYGYCDKIILCVNLDATSRTAGLLAGDYDFGSVLADMQPQAKEAGLKVAYLHNEWAPAIFFNLHESNKDSPINDKNLRKAIRAALDMEAIMLAIREGDETAFVLDPNPMSMHSIYHNDVIKNADWNIADEEKVREYLEASDYDGEPIQWLCAQSASFYSAAVVGIQALQDVGINAEMKLVDAGSHSAMRNDPATGHDIGAWETQKASTVPTAQTSFVTGDSGGWWENDEKSRLLSILGSAVMGSEESVNAYYEFCELAAEEVPWIVFGELYTIRYAVPELELNYDGTHAYYWNSYFAK